MAKMQKNAPKTPSKDTLKELTETLQHVQAEFENYKKQVDKRFIKHCDYAAQKLITSLLPVLDEFELAMNNTANHEEFVKGMRMVQQHLCKILEKEGLRTIEAMGKQFDPYKHEVLLQEEADCEEGIILQEIQKGYLLHDAVIRHSKVKICKKVKANED